MDLVIINPGNRRDTYGSLADEFSGLEPPVFCALRAAVARDSGFSAAILDADALGLTPKAVVEYVVNQNPLIVEIIVLGTNPSASSTPKMATVSLLLKQLKEIAPTVKTILSGLHPSALPERTLKEEQPDFICQGEGFSTVVKLLKRLKSGVDEFSGIEGLWYKKDGTIFSNTAAPLVEDLDKLPFVAWDLLPMDKYRAHNWHCLGDLTHRSPYAALYTSLGCPFICSYCNINALYNGKPGIRYRSPKKVFEEIVLLHQHYGVKNIKICDELFVINDQRVLEICDLLIERRFDLNIWAYARIDTIKENLLRKLRAAGFRWLCFGIESANERVRAGVSKKIIQNQIRQAIQMTKEAGIYTLGNYIFGLPDDNLKTMEDTLALAQELNCEYANFYTAMAYPGSLLYQEAVQKNLPLPSSWQGYAQLAYETVPLPTRYLTSEEVLRFRDKAFVAYYSNPRYIDLVRKTFGEEAVRHIKAMLEKPLRRKILSGE